MKRSSTLTAGLLAGFFMSASFAADKPWTLAGNSLIPSEDLATLAGNDPDGVQLAGRIVQAYRDRGYFTVEAQVDPAAHTIRVIEAPARASGPYAGYLAAAGEGVVTREDLELAAARMTPAARLNGERVQIDIRPADPRTGAVEIQTATVPIEDYKAGGFAAVFSTYGQRYAGADVATLYGYRNIGGGQQIDGSISHGFPSWREDSKGGRYENLSLGWKRAGVEGMTTAQLAYVDYKTGGITAPLDMTGTVARLQVEHSYLVRRDLFAVGRVIGVANRQRLGLTGWTDAQDYGALYAGVRYTGATIAGDLGIEQGIGGRQSYSMTPLLGRFDKNYSALIANVSATVGLGESGWAVVAKAGGQAGSDGTPSSSQFFLGGPDRGVSYNTGYAAVPSGWYASASINAPTIHGVQAYAGIDHAEGNPVVGRDRKAKSAFVGARFQIGKNITGDASIASAIGALDDPTAERTKFNLFATIAF